MARTYFLWERLAKNKPGEPTVATLEASPCLWPSSHLMLGCRATSDF